MSTPTWCHINDLYGVKSKDVATCKSKLRSNNNIVHLYKSYLHFYDTVYFKYEFLNDFWCYGLVSKQKVFTHTLTDKKVWEPLRSKIVLNSYDRIKCDF